MNEIRRARRTNLSPNGGGIASATRSDPESPGFSILEALVAAALLLLITIGILPFFTRSIVNNVQGAKAMETTNLARSKIEELYQLPFDSPELTLDPGGSERLSTEYFSRREGRWIGEESWRGSETAAFTRTIRIRQFGVGALRDNRQFDDGEALFAGVTPSFVHLKEIEVEVKTPDQLSALGRGKRVKLRVYKPF